MRKFIDLYLVCIAPGGGGYWQHADLALLQGNPQCPWPRQDVPNPGQGMSWVAKAYRQAGEYGPEVFP